MSESGTLFQLHEKPWESRIIGKQVYELRFVCPTECGGCDSEAAGAAIASYLCRESVVRPSMVVVRLEASCATAIRSLEQAGFRRVEQYLQYCYPLLNTPPRYDGNHINRMSDEDLHAVERLAERSFSCSRFHMDDFIPTAIANETRRIWARDACLERSNVVFVARAGVTITGFLVCRQRADGGRTAGCLDLMAVDPSMRRQGIGVALTCVFLSHCRENGYHQAVVGTQSHNLASNALYRKTGFRVSKTYVTYHRHVS